MSEQSAIRLLQTAIANVRDNCTDPRCKSLITQLDAADKEAQSVLDEYGTGDEPPTSMKDASAKVRIVFAQKRAAAK